MTTTAPCNCDQAKAWEARATAAEAEARALRLSLRFARQQLERLLDKVDVAIGAAPAEVVEEVHTLDGHGGVLITVQGLESQSAAMVEYEQDLEARQQNSKSWRKLATWMRDQLAAKASST